MKNKRLFIGLLCILCAIVLCFVGIPALTASTKSTCNILRIKKPVSAGAQITADDIETAEVGKYGLPDAVLKEEKEVIGKYATADLMKGDYILKEKVADQSAEGALMNLPENQVAISLSTQSLAAGMSYQLHAGDIISIYHYNEDKKAELVPELQYVKVLSVVASDGADKAADAADGDTTATQKALQYATITVSATRTQALKIADVEAEGKCHVALAYRGDATTADGYLTLQAQILSVMENPEAPQINKGA